MTYSKTKTLIVDDSMTTRRIARHCLQDAGFELIDEAIDGEQAWTKLSTASPPYDLIIADWHMPNLTGLGLLKRIRSSDQFQSVVVVMATAERNKEEISKVAELKVNGYVVKPYEPARLLEVVKKALGKVGQTGS
jgi:two-component system, chemotaxis family, chemotaxis protein CheY